MMLISDSAFRFLATQQGVLDPIKEDRTKWHDAYEQGLRDKFATFSKYLPIPCRSVLDVGSGLGGINILVHGQTKADIYLLDGIDDEPIMQKSFLTHNSMEVARNFLAVNGVALAGFFSPTLKLYAAQRQRPTFDLVLSLSAWCFHFPPREYLSFVVERMGPSGRMVVDVRKDRPDYDSELNEHLKLIDVVTHARKFERRVYERA